MRTLRGFRSVCDVPTAHVALSLMACHFDRSKGPDIPFAKSHFLRSKGPGGVIAEARVEHGPFCRRGAHAGWHSS